MNKENLIYCSYKGQIRSVSHILHIRGFSYLYKISFVTCILSTPTTPHYSHSHLYINICLYINIRVTLAIIITSSSSFRSDLISSSSTSILRSLISYSSSVDTTTSLSLLVAKDSSGFHHPSTRHPLPCNALPKHRQPSPLSTNN